MRYIRLRLRIVMFLRLWPKISVIIRAVIRGSLSRSIIQSAEIVNGEKERSRILIIESVEIFPIS